MNVTTTSVLPVAPAQLRRAEWLQLTFGLFWRSVLQTIAASILGAAVSFVVASGLRWAVGGAPDPEAYRRIATPVMVLINLGIGFLVFGLYTLWILSARYGPLRLVVVRHRGAEPSPPAPMAAHPRDATPIP